MWQEVEQNLSTRTSSRGSWGIQQKTKAGTIAGTPQDGTRNWPGTPSTPSTPSTTLLSSQSSQTIQLSAAEGRSQAQQGLECGAAPVCNDRRRTLIQQLLHYLIWSSSKCTTYESVRMHPPAETAQKETQYSLLWTRPSRTLPWQRGNVATWQRGNMATWQRHWCRCVVQKINKPNGKPRPQAPDRAKDCLHLGWQWSQWLHNWHRSRHKSPALTWGIKSIVSFSSPAFLTCSCKGSVESAVPET